MAAINCAYHLTGRIFSVNCIFLYGDLATNRSLGSRARLRLSAARSGFLLRPLSARPFRGKASQGYRSAGVGPCKMAQGSGARARATRYLHSHGGIPQTCPGDFRHFGWFGRSQSPRAVSSAELPPGSAIPRFPRLIFPQPPFIEETCTKVQVKNCQATLRNLRDSNENRRQVPQNAGDSAIDGQLVRG